MIRAFIRHSVNDYGAWRKVYDEFDSTRSGLGVIGQAVYQAVGNPNDVTITHDFNTIEEAQAFGASAELKDAMQAAGVIGPPQLCFQSTKGRVNR